MTWQGGLLTALLYLVLPAVQAGVYLAGLPFADPVDVVNFASSIFAYYWLLANVAVSLKLPIFQYGLPYDLRIRLHVWTTAGLGLMLLWHGIYTIFLKAKDIDLVTWTLLGVFVGLVGLSLLWIPLPGFRNVRKALLGWAGRGWLRSYDWMKASHKVLFLALAALTFVHIVLVEIIATVPWWSGVLYPLAFAATGAAFLWARFHNRILPSLKVSRVVSEGGIVRLDLEPHKRLKYRAGQFAFLRFAHRDLKGEEHPFSFVTAPHEPRVGFAVRALGDYTDRLPVLQPGDVVRVNGGFGAFHPHRGWHPLALIGSGIGAVPLVSILKDLAHREPHREVVCLLAVNRRSELVEIEALEALRATMPRLTLRTFVRDEGSPLYSAELFQRELGSPRRYRYYLCSSDQVRTIVTDALASLGVGRRQIHFEAFNLG